VGSPQITRKLMAVYDDLEPCVPPARAASIETQRAWLLDEVVRGAPLPAERILSPDPLGLG
jgi:hypothetical protein